MYLRYIKSRIYVSIPKIYYYDVNFISSLFENRSFDTIHY